MKPTRIEALAKVKRNAAFRIRWEMETRTWNRLLRTVTKSELSAEHFLIVPPDPWTVLGTLGDEAMITAIVEGVRRHNQHRKVVIVTATEGADIAARRAGMIPLRCWNTPFSVEGAIRAVAELVPSTVVIIGADVLDGHYSAFTSMRLLQFARVASTLGSRTRIVGFSLNARPSQLVTSLFRSLANRADMFIRDPISLERFRAAYGRDVPATLVADVAFTLQPQAESSLPSGFVQWISSERSNGRIVAGFNIHHMLLRDPTRADLHSLASNAAQAIIEAANSQSISWLLIPHDFRPEYGDQTMLALLTARLEQLGCLHFKIAQELRSASAIKALVAHLDCIVASRMHLAIAALSMGVPTGAVAYQDKFEGLWEHFRLPAWTILSPLEISTRLAPMCTALVEHRNVLRTTIQQHLPRVLDLARMNLAD